MTVPGWQQAPAVSPTPSPTSPSTPSPRGRSRRGAGWDRRWLAVVVALSVLAVSAATASAVLFLSPGSSEAATSDASGGTGSDDAKDAAGQEKSAKAATDSGPGKLVPVERAEAHQARTPETESKGATSEERIAEHTYEIGESVLFSNGAGIRIDAIEPAELWPGSKHDLLLEDPRAFAIRYTYTNFSDQPVEVRRLRSVDLAVEPFDPDLKWPEGKYPEVVLSNSAALADGISALSWPELDQQVEDYMLSAGESVQGVFVTYEIRKGEAKVRVEVGEYREEGHAWYLLDVPS